MNKHTGTTQSETLTDVRIEVLPSGHATVYLGRVVLADIVLTDDTTAENLQRYMTAAHTGWIASGKGYEVPLASGRTTVLTGAHISHITSTVTAIQGARRGGRQSDGISLRAELEADYPELSWSDLKSVMVWDATGRTLQADGTMR
ncbi:MAG TPA: hypothetical protein VLG91_20305 [Streptomyces sp.]|nr:hypothetical protein [Streptomyces sp.]